METDVSMKRVCCLYRVSTNKQLIEGDIPVQSNACHNFAASKGWNIVLEYSEKGVSGSKVSGYERDAIQGILNEVRSETRSFDILLVFMWDRLGRIDDETPLIVSFLIRRGIEVWSVKEGQKVIENPNDRLYNYLDYWFASGESRKTSIRVKEKMGQLAQAGLFRGGTPPYGYRMVQNGRTNGKSGMYEREVHDLEIDEAEAAVIRRIFELSLCFGYGGRKIASVLYEEKIFNRKGEKFHYSTIQHILKNPSYTGIIRSGEIRSPVIPNLQIISEEQFRLTQEQASSRRTDNTGERLAPVRAAGKTLLSGNVFCKHCGGRIFASTTRKNHHHTKSEGPFERIPVYKCYNRTQHKDLCEGQSVYSARKIDEVIDSVVIDILNKVKCGDSDSFIKEHKKKALRSIQTQLEQSTREYEKKQTELKKLSEYIISAIEGNGPFSAEDLKERMDVLKEDTKGLLEKIGTLNGSLSEAQNLEERFAQQWKELSSYADVYRTAEFDEKRQIVSKIIRRVEVGRGYDIDIDLRFSADECI